MKTHVDLKHARTRLHKPKGVKLARLNERKRIDRDNQRHDLPVSKETKLESSAMLMARSEEFRLGSEIQTSSVVGDSVWNMLAARRAPSLGIGLLSGGYGQEELERAGAYRVYEDPADLLRHIDEVGGRQ